MPIYPINRRRRRRYYMHRFAAGALGVLTLTLVSAPAMGAHPLLSSIAAQTVSKPLIRGYPVVLGSGADGGVWYGGAWNLASEYVERIDHIDTSGAFSDLLFPPGLIGHWPQYLAAEKGGGEWFIAESQHEGSLLGRVSPLRAVELVHLLPAPAGKLRGLALGPEGDLWTTEAGQVGRHSLAAILRITPDGQVTSFRKGLGARAAPSNITAGPSGAMWFLDDAGYLGRITASGAIREFAVGRAIKPLGIAFAPSRPVVASRDGAIWFIVDDRTIARADGAGHVRLFRPRSSYAGSEALGEEGTLVGLDASIDGEVWFTRFSGEVAEIDRRGRVRTVTNRLVQGLGIAFDGNGVAWVGEEPAFGGEDSTPARMARIDPDGLVTQYPPRTRCPVPDVLGYDHGFAASTLQFYRPFPDGPEHANSECGERVRLGPITIAADHRSAPLVAVSQTPRPGTLTEGYVRVAVVLDHVPPRPRSCHVPHGYRVQARTAQLLVWRAYDGEPTNGTETDYGCVRPHGRVRLIDRQGETLEGGSGVTRMIAAGHFVAYAVTGGSKYGGGATITVYDLERGHATFEVPVDAYSSGYVQGSPEPNLPGLERLGGPVGRGVDELVLDTPGDVAWVGNSEAKSPQLREAVLYLHDHGGLRKLAVASHISMLTFRGNILTWQQEGIAKSVRLSSPAPR